MQGSPGTERYQHGLLESEHTNGEKIAHNSCHNHPYHRRIQSHEAWNYIDQHYQVPLPRMNAHAILQLYVDSAVNTCHNTE